MMDGIVLELIRLNETVNLDELENPSNFQEKTKLKYLLDRYREADSEVKLESKSEMMTRLDLVYKLISLIAKVPLGKLFKSKYVKDYFSSLQEMFLSRVFLALGLYQSGIWLMKKALEGAEKLENWGEVLTGASILIPYYAVRGDAKNRDKYSALAQHSINMVSKQLELKGMFNKWVLMFSKKRNANEIQINELANDLVRAKEIVGDLKYVNMVHMVKRLELMHYDAQMDFESLIETAEETKAFLTKNSGYTDFSKLGIYLGIQMYAYLNLKKVAEAKGLAGEIGKFIKEGTMNWYIFMEYYFVLLLQSNEYEKANELLEQIQTSKGFALLKGVQKNIWVLLSAYMQFVAIVKIWKNVPSSFNQNVFRTSKFINQVLNLGSDKTGLNVSVLILQVLFLLQYKRYEEIIDRKDAIRRYMYRYLYSKENERSRLFLIMLLKMIDNDFLYIKTSEKTKRLYKKLQGLEMNYRANLGGNEIVDYEILWGWVLKVLQSR
ncbi:MAG: hypothetical protein ACPGLV_06785 [Bacteroidia bacterium]